MADRIISLQKLNNSWCISYIVEKDSLSNSFCVDVLHSEMTDPESDTEARSLGNAKAAIIKDAWSAEAPSPVIQMIESPENVTL